MKAQVLIAILISILLVSCSSLKYTNQEYDEDNFKGIDSIQIEERRAPNKISHSWFSDGILYITYNGRTYDVSGHLVH